MAITKQKLIDDIILRITKGAPSDDLELSSRQVAHWFDTVAGEIVPKYLESKVRRHGTIDSILLEIEDDLEGTVENVAMLDQYTDRVYIQTTKEIMDVANDIALLRVITEEGTALNRVPIERLDTLNSMRFSRPSPDNMLYSKIDQKIYIHGLSPKSVATVMFSVTFIPKVNISGLDDSDTVKLPDELIGLVSDAVEDKAKRQMLGVPDVENDAEDDNQLR